MGERNPVNYTGLVEDPPVVDSRLFVCVKLDGITDALIQQNEKPRFFRWVSFHYFMNQKFTNSLYGSPEAADN